MANKAAERERLARFELAEQTRFVKELGDAGLPAASLTAITTALEGGSKIAVALSDALDQHELALGEAGVIALAEVGDKVSIPAIPDALKQVDLSDQIILPRDTFRDVLKAVAMAERPVLGKANTVKVDGQPGSELSLNEKLATASPSEAVALVNEAVAQASKDGKALV